MLTGPLDDYRRHAEFSGPELVVETAAHELDELALAEVRSYIRHLERTKRWHRASTTLAPVLDHAEVVA
jgi:hypothetical protein